MGRRLELLLGFVGDSGLVLIALFDRIDVLDVHLFVSHFGPICFEAVIRLLHT